MRSIVRAGLEFARVVSIGRFFLGLAFGLLVAAALWGGAFLWSMGLPLSFTDRNIAAWYRVKSSILEETRGSRRIVLVGGSNVLYGISAEQIEAATGIPTVNFGTHAALNLDYIFWKLIKKLRSGDDVVLSLEWDFFNRAPTDLNEVSGPYLAATETEYLSRLPTMDRVRLTMTSGWDRLALPLQISRRDSGRIQELFNVTTGLQTLNRRGDIIHNSPAEKGPKQQSAIAAVTILAGLVLESRSDRNDPVWKRIENFVKACRKKGVTVFVTFPSMMDDPGYRTPEAAKVYRRFEENFRNAGAKILTTQEETLYPKDFFFDTFYHLHWEARRTRTGLIIDALARAGVPSAKSAP